MSINLDQNDIQESYKVIILTLTEANETIPRLSRRKLYFRRMTTLSLKTIDSRNKQTEEEEI